MSNTPPIRLAVLEDDDSAVELLRALLAAEGLECAVEHATDEPSYRAALAPPPDLIISDYNLPTIDGATALQIRNEMCRDTPFILVSGAVGEAAAIDLLKSGVTDFVLKDELPRLVPAIRRSLSVAHEHIDRMRAEQALRESEARFRRLAENAPDVIFRYRFAEGRWRCDYISPAVERVAGYAPEEFYGNSFLPLQIVHPDDRGAMHELLKESAVPKAAAEIRWIARDGRLVVTHQRFVSVVDEAGKLVGIEGIARDVTGEHEEAARRRALEQQLFQAQKMESIGALAGGIAHDFNNILTGILGFAELATIEAKKEQISTEALDEIKKAGLRARDLVAQILTFCRNQEAQPVPVDLSRVTADALKFLRASIPATIAIERNLKACHVLAVPTQLHQVVLNLCTNAVYAMNRKIGTLTVEVETVEVGPELAAKTTTLQPGPHACLLVRDTGQGMAPEVIARIYDPMFTTKPAGEGTGLGLAVVRNIVDACHGGITVESALGRGTTFRVFFPLCSRVPEPEVKVGSVPLGQGQLILVVDDEASVGAFVGLRLQRLNYCPVVFKDPRQALAAVQAVPGRFAGMLTDLGMPGMSGVDLVREVRRIAGPLPAVIMTGNRAELPPAPEMAEVEMLDKPFTGEALAAVLDRLLAGSAKSDDGPGRAKT